MVKKLYPTDSEPIRFIETHKKIRWDENTCIVYNEIANADHSYVATRCERSRNENSWKLVLNSVSANGPLDHRDDCKEAKKTCNRIYKKYAATARCVNTGIHPQDQVRQRPDQQSEGHDNDFNRIDSETGVKYYYLQPPRVFLLLHHLGGNHPTAGGQHGIGNLHHGMSNRFLCKLQM